MSFSCFLNKDDYTWPNALLMGNCIKHFQKVQKGSLGNRAIHLLIGITESLPVIGQIISIFEKIIAGCFQSQNEIPRNDVNLSGHSSSDQLNPDKCTPSISSNNRPPNPHDKLHEELPSIQPSFVNQNEEEFDTTYEAKIYIGARSGGTPGPKFDSFPREFNDWKLANGEDIPIKKNTLFLTFLLYDPTENLAKFIGKGIPTYLPAYLFKEKKEGESIFLQYRGQIVKLTLSQAFVAERNQQNPEEWQFEHVLENTVSNINEKIENGEQGFDGKFMANNWRCKYYTLNHQGELFQYKKSQQNTLNVDAAFNGLIQLDQEQFRKTALKGDFDQNIIIYSSDNAVRIDYVMTGISDCVDIVINEKYLCFFAKEKSEALDLEYTYEYLCVIPWKKYFNNRSLEQMQEAIKNGKAKLEYGIFHIIISK